MGKMKQLREDLVEREDDIQKALCLAGSKRPELYGIVSATPNVKSVTSLLRDITEEKYLILLITAYLSNQINPE